MGNGHGPAHSHMLPPTNTPSHHTTRQDTLYTRGAQPRAHTPPFTCPPQPYRPSRESSCVARARAGRPGGWPAAPWRARLAGPCLLNSPDHHHHHHVGPVVALRGLTLISGSGRGCSRAQAVERHGSTQNQHCPQVQPPQPPAGAAAAGVCARQRRGDPKQQNSCCFAAWGTHRDSQF